MSLVSVDWAGYSGLETAEDARDAKALKKGKLGENEPGEREAPPRAWTAQSPVPTRIAAQRDCFLASASSAFPAVLV
jgi:hypothetical protein